MTVSFLLLCYVRELSSFQDGKSPPPLLITLVWFRSKCFFVLDHHQPGNKERIVFLSTISPSPFRSLASPLLLQSLSLSNLF
jgi:hypothetical protein